MGRDWHQTTFQSHSEALQHSTQLNWKANEKTIKIKSEVCHGWDKYAGEITLQSFASRQRAGKVIIRYEPFSNPFFLKYREHNGPRLHLMKGLIKARWKWWLEKIRGAQLGRTEGDVWVVEKKPKPPTEERFSIYASANSTPFEFTESRLIHMPNNHVYKLVETPHYIYICISVYMYIYLKWANFYI